MGDQTLNGDASDEIVSNLEVEDGIKAELDDESLRLSSVLAEECFEAVVSKFRGEGDDSSSSSSSSDEETEDVPVEKTEVVSTESYENEENGVSDPIVEEEVFEIETTQATEEPEEAVAAAEEETITVEAVEETVDQVSPEAELVAEEKEIIISDETEKVKVIEEEEELSDVVAEIPVEESSQVAAVEEVVSTVVETKEAEYVDQANTDTTLHNGKEKDNLQAITEPGNGTRNGNKVEIPESNGNPHIISISTRTVRPTSWRGCCGLLDVFRGGR